MATEDKNLSLLNDKVLKFLEQKKLAELKQPNKKQKKQEDKDEKNMTKKQKMIYDLFKKAKKCKFPLDNKQLAKMCIRKIQQFHLFLDEYANKQEKKREELSENELKDVKEDLKIYVDEKQDEKSEPKSERLDNIQEKDDMDGAGTECMSPDIQSIDDNLIQPPESIKIKIYNSEYIYKLYL